MLLIFFASCVKEVVEVEDEMPVGEAVVGPIVNGHPVTIAAGLPADTKITHVYDGSDNQLYFPTAALVINSFRGYFVLGSSIQPGAASINEP